eukprot:SAG31_NODE_214_length_20084_cov_2.644684_4_plen_166_part_00
MSTHNVQPGTPFSYHHPSVPRRCVAIDAASVTAKLILVLGRGRAAATGTEGGGGGAALGSLGLLLQLRAGVRGDQADAQAAVSFSWSTPEPAPCAALNSGVVTTSAKRRVRTHGRPFQNDLYAVLLWAWQTPHGRHEAHPSDSRYYLSRTFRPARTLCNTNHIQV